MNRAKLEKPFDRSQIRQRQGRSGMLDYVEGWSVVQRLNEALDGVWSFEVAATGFLQPKGVTGVDSARNTIFCDARGKDAVSGTTMSAARGVLVGQTGRARVTRDITTSPSAPQDLRSGDWPDCP